MGLKTFSVNFQNISKEKTFRYDVDFSYFQNDFFIDNYYAFNDLFEIKKNNKVNIENLNDDFLYSEIGNVSKDGEVKPVRVNFAERKEDEEKYYKKIEKGDIIQVEEQDILLSKVRPNLKKYILINEENVNYFYTSAFIHLKSKLSGTVFYYSLRTIFYDNLISISRQGKGYPTLNEDDFLNLKFDKAIIDKLIEKQNEIVAQIESIENTIKKLKSQITPAQEIINKVFAREFRFDLEGFKSLKRIKNYYIDFFAFGNNRDIRQSVKFHREAGTFIIKQLKKITNKKVKDFISEPIVLGKGVSPKDYDENGDYYYISMANIKNYQFETEDSKLLSKEYSDKNQNKAVAKNDILIARSGEGTIGKVALIDDEDLQGIFADFTMRIRLQKCNPLFAYYYFRTEYFQYLIEINKKGLGNNTNIFPSQIQELPMIDICVKEQKKIVDEIKAELDKQEEIKNKIKCERDKIDEIIEKAIK